LDGNYSHVKEAEKGSATKKGVVFRSTFTTARTVNLLLRVCAVPFG